ncbi:MAG: transposase [Magnetospirillum sp.]|nr:transposase [Magnetospirillum sp.]
MEGVAAALLSEKPTDGIEASRPIVIVDATSIGAPGGNGSDRVLHGRCDPETGFNGFELTDQHGGETLTRHRFRAGDIVLADRGYAHLKGLLHVLEQGADFVLRTGWRRLALRDESGGKFDPLVHFKDLPLGQTADVPISIATSGKPLPIRPVVFARDEAGVEAEVRRVNRKAAKNQCPVNPRSQMAARYMMIVTSLDPQVYPAEMVLALDRRRWQIEIAFKRLKSLIHIDRLPAKNEGLARTWLYAHLVFTLLIDKLARHMLDPMAYRLFDPPRKGGLQSANAPLS